LTCRPRCLPTLWFQASRAVTHRWLVEAGSWRLAALWGDPELDEPGEPCWGWPPVGLRTPLDGPQASRMRCLPQALEGCSVQGAVAGDLGVLGATLSATIEDSTIVVSWHVVELWEVEDHRHWGGVP
jgi:hypothetical protein